MDVYDVVSKSVRFWSFLVVLIPSIFCSLFILYHFLFDRILLRAMHNHVFIVIISLGLVSQVTYYPWTLYQLRLNEIWFRSPAFCAISEFINQNFYSIQTFLFAWATLERHVLIFHDRWMRKQSLRFLLHYLPIIAVLGYCFIFYSYTFFFPPCDNLYYDSDHGCMWPCLWVISEFSFYELYANQIVPLCTIALFSLLLLIRVIRMKMRVRQPDHWRRDAKMAIQLLFPVLVYLIFVLPYIIVLIISFSVTQTEFLDFLMIIFGFIYYFGILVTPFVCIISSNDLRSRWTGLFRWLGPRRTTIAPIAT